jgi:dissimilatory sulfite reductase (desulfoviridin) alpha/beta subunit
MAEIDYGTLKKGGFMRQVQNERFSLRLRVVGGRLKSEQLAKIAEIASVYGRGYTHFTSRQGVEIPFIAFQDIDAVTSALAAAGLQPGACGPRVRTVTACQGASICPSGLIETAELAQELDARYYGLELPHKFKIGVTGCPNNCLKAEENDLGVKGGTVPEWNRQACTDCGLCIAVCPVQAVKPDHSLDSSQCRHCGKCVKSCPADAWTGKKGYLLFFGGSFGNTITVGRRLLPLLVEKEKLFRAADAAIGFFRAYGKRGERFAKTIARTGSEMLQEKLLESL